MLEAIRGELIATSAVMPNEVEEVDLGKYPGLEKLHETLDAPLRLYPVGTHHLQA